MHVNLVIKADDPTAAAEKLRVMGYEREPPNRPNPDRWTSSIAGTISILPADGDDCGLALAVPSFERLHCIAGTTGEIAPGYLRLEMGNAWVAFVEDGGPIRRPFGDRMYAFHAETVLRSARDELAAVFDEYGIDGAILIGPETLSGVNANAAEYDASFALVIRDVDGSGLANIRSILERHAVPGVTVDVVMASELDDAVLAKAERTAWDVEVRGRTPSR